MKSEGEGGGGGRGETRTVRKQMSLVIFGSDRCVAGVGQMSDRYGIGG